MTCKYEIWQCIFLNNILPNAITIYIYIQIMKKLELSKKNVQSVETSSSEGQLIKSRQYKHLKKASHIQKLILLNIVIFSSATILGTLDILEVSSYLDPSIYTIQMRKTKSVLKGIFHLFQLLIPIISIWNSKSMYNIINLKKYITKN